MDALERALAVELGGPLVRGVGEGVLSFSPLSLFSVGEQGALFNFTDAAATYQDSAGTTAGVAGQGIGLELDRRFGLVRGPELVTNGDFSQGLTGWADAGGDGSAAVVGGVLQITEGATAHEEQRQVLTVIAGKAYEISATLGGTSPVVFLGSTASGADLGNMFATGRKIIVAATSQLSLRCQTLAALGSGAVATFDSFSVRLVDGNHLIQATTASKPTWQAGYASFDSFDDFLPATTGGGGTSGILLCAGIRAGAAGTARTIWSDRGTNTGYRLSLDTSNALVLSAGNGTAFTSVTGPTITAGTDYVVMGWHDGANLNVRVGLASATSAAFATATAGTAGFTLGRDNGTAAGQYGDRIYSLLYRKNDTSTAAQRDGVSRYLANLSAITL